MAIFVCYKCRRDAGLVQAERSQTNSKTTTNSKAVGLCGILYRHFCNQRLQIDFTTAIILSLSSNYIISFYSQNVTHLITIGLPIYDNDMRRRIPWWDARGIMHCIPEASIVLPDSVSASETCSCYAGAVMTHCRNQLQLLQLISTVFRRAVLPNHNSNSILPSDFLHFTSISTFLPIWAFSRLIVYDSLMNFNPKEFTIACFHSLLPIRQECAPLTKSITSRNFKRIPYQ